MSDVVVSLTERRLARDGVKITFFKALIKMDAIERRFPGGLEGFVERYKRITPKRNLVGVTFINMAELDKFMETVEQFGIRRGVDFGTANQLHGELTRCQGIRLVPVSRQPNPGATICIPVWYACTE